MYITAESSSNVKRLFNRCAWFETNAQTPKKTRSPHKIRKWCSISKRAVPSINPKFTVFYKLLFVSTLVVWQLHIYIKNKWSAWKKGALWYCAYAHSLYLSITTLKPKILRALHQDKDNSLHRTFNLHLKRTIVCLISWSQREANHC